jgi:hypothetical protein
VGIILNQSTGTFSGATNVTGTFTGSLGAIDGAQPYSTAGQTVTLAVVNCPDPGDHIPDPSESAAETAGDRICMRPNQCDWCSEFCRHTPFSREGCQF